MNGTRATFPELSAEESRRMVDLSTLQFTTTAELEPLITLVGQERATQALHMGLGMRQQGYNIFVCGFEGTGAQTQIAALLRERAATLPTPGDWVYVHNFRYPDQRAGRPRADARHHPQPGACTLAATGPGHDGLCRQSAERRPTNRGVECRLGTNAVGTLRSNVCRWAQNRVQVAKRSWNRGGRNASI
jgi:AAA domain